MTEYFCKVIGAQTILGIEVFRISSGIMTELPLHCAIKTQNIQTKQNDQSQSNAIPHFELQNGIM